MSEFRATCLGPIPSSLLRHLGCSGDHLLGTKRRFLACKLFELSLALNVSGVGVGGHSAFQAMFRILLLVINCVWFNTRTFGVRIIWAVFRADLVILDYVLLWAEPGSAASKYIPYIDHKILLSYLNK